jgi:hypothetical protein
MIVSKMSLSIVAFAAIVLMITTGASALQVNETIEDFGISFDAANDTNTIAKIWGGQAEYGLGHPFGTGPANASKYYVLLAGNISNFSTLKEGCVVIIFENPINTSSNKTKAILVEETSGMHIETTNRIVDGQNATIAEIRNNTAESLVEYRAIYWIDEVDGMATKGNIVFSTYPWDEGTETLLNTIHVKEGSH